jgi:hypothetical protein
MKTEAEISVRVRDLLRSEATRRVEDASKRLPHNCRFNYRHPLDERRNVDGEANPDYNCILPAVKNNRTIGLCMYGAENPTEWPGTICEDESDAVQCPWFDPLRTPDVVVREFQENIRDPAWLEENMPVVHTLRWVLDDTTEMVVQERPSREAIVPVPALRWWQRLIWRLFLPGKF